MIINKEIAEQLYDELNETRQISKIAVSKDDFVNWCHTRNLMTGLGYKKRMFGDDELSDYKVPKELSDIMIPRKVSQQVGEEFLDMRGSSYTEYSSKVKDYGMESAKVLDAVKFNQVSKAIAGSRKQQLRAVSADELIGETTIATVEDRLNNLSKGINKSLIKVTDKHYMPIDFQYNFMESSFYTQKISNTVKKWFSDALDKLSNNQA